MAVLFQREKKLLKECLGHEGRVERQEKQTHRFEREGQRETRKEWDINGFVTHYVLLLGSHELKMQKIGKEERKKNHGEILVPLLIYDGHIIHDLFTLSTSES